MRRLCPCPCLPKVLRVEPGPTAAGDLRQPLVGAAAADNPPAGVGTGAGDGPAAEAPDGEAPGAGDGPEAGDGPDAGDGPEGEAPDVEAPYADDSPDAEPGRVVYTCGPPGTHGDVDGDAAGSIMWFLTRGR